MKGITATPHGLADLAYAPLVFCAPKLGGFEKDKLPSALCRWMALSTVAYSSITDAKWGLVKLMPYRVHALLDLAMGIGTLALAATPVAKKKNVRNTFLIMGLTGLIVGTLSVIGSKRSD